MTNKMLFISIIDLLLVELKRGELPRPVGGRGAKHITVSLPSRVLQHGDALRRV